MIFPIHQGTCGLRRMQNMAADHTVRMCIRFDSRHDCVPHRFKRANTCGVVSRKEIVKIEAVRIILITRFFCLFFNYLNQASDDRGRLRSLTKIMENVGIDHQVDVILLAFGDSVEPVKLSHFQKLTQRYSPIRHARCQCQAGKNPRVKKPAGVAVAKYNTGIVRERNAMPPEQERNAGCVVNIRRKIIRVRATSIAPYAAVLHGTYKEANCLAYNFLDPVRFCEIEAVRDLSGLKSRVIRFAFFFQEWMRRAKDLKCSGRQLRSMKKIDPLRDGLL